MSNSIKYSVLHAVKRAGWEKLYQEWCEKAAAPEDFEYVVAVHESDKGLVATQPAKKSGTLTIVIQQTADNCVANWNAAAEMCKGDVLITAADDLHPCEFWDLEISIASQNSDARAHIVNNQWVMSINNGPGTNPNLISHPIMSRELYEKWGHELLYHEYESMYSDNDLTEHATAENCIIQAQQVQFAHHHPFCGTGKMDAVYEKQNRQQAYQSGSDVLIKRRADGFGTGVPWIPPRATVAVALPGETFSDVWVAHWTSLFAELQARYVVAATFGYCSNVYMTRGSICDNLLTGGRPIDYVLWLDDDNVLRYDQFEMLMQALRDHPELDGVVGWCWVQPDNYGIEPCVSCGMISADGITSIPMSYQKLMEGETDLRWIDYSGFPVVLMRFETLKKAGKYPFAAIRDDRLSWGMSGEDTAFFIHAKENGCKFAVDRRIKVPHFKRRAAEPDMRAYEGITLINKPDGSGPAPAPEKESFAVEVPTPV